MYVEKELVMKSSWRNVVPGFELRVVHDECGNIRVIPNDPVRHARLIASFKKGKKGLSHVQ